MDQLTYTDGSAIEINDVVIVPDLGAFCGHVSGLDPVRGEVEVISDNPADHGRVRVWVTPDRLYNPYLDVCEAEPEQDAVSPTARYTVEDTTSYYPYRRSYSVRLPDVQQVPGAATRYLENTAGRRRAFRSAAAAQKVADSMNAVFDRAMANLTAEATEAERQRAHAAHEALEASLPVAALVASHNDGHGNVVLRFPTPLSAASWVAQWGLQREAVQSGALGTYDQPVDVTLPFAAWMQAAGF